jgi:transcriptional regulator GlxA family with amidase domain
LLDLYGPLEMFGNLKPQVKIVTVAEKDGPIFTSSGVSAGMDMSLAVIARLFGEDKATEIANYTEYVWNQDPDEDPFHQYLNMLVPE